MSEADNFFPPFRTITTTICHLLIQIAYLLLFLTLLYLAVENLALGAGLPAIHVFAKENEERKTLNERLQARKHEFRSSQASQDLSGLIQTRKPFTWEALTYDVDVSGGQKRLLDEIYGYVKPGTLTALMGSSGMLSLSVNQLLY